MGRIKLTIPVSAIELTIDCSTGQSHSGVPIFFLIDPDSINSVFALFDCFGAILYVLLTAGPIDLVYQSGAYDAFAGFWWTRENDIYFRGPEEERPNFEGNRDNIREQGI